MIIGRSLAIVVLVVVSLLAFIESAAAETIRVAWPVWVVMEVWRLGNLTVWAFVGFIFVCAPKEDRT
jgi:hypothetical protein